MKPLIQSATLAVSVSLLPLQPGASEDASQDVPLPEFDSVEEQLEAAMRSYHQLPGAALPVEGEPEPVAEKVLNLLEPLAGQGCAQAQYMLALMYARGEEQESVDWARRAAEQGHAAAQWRIARAYDGASDHTDYPRHDGEEALKWFRRSADQGHFRSMLELYRLYYTGSVVSGKNLIEAYKWHALMIPRVPVNAEDSPLVLVGRDQQKRDLEALTEEMTAEEIAEARSRVEDWEDGHGNPHHVGNQTDRSFRFWFRRVEGGCDR